MQESTQDLSSIEAESDELLRLRKLLIGAEYEDLLALKNCLNDPKSFSQKISGVISESISERLKNDQSLPTVLAPTISQAIKESIAKDPKSLADSLYPVMGPAIRKSIAETMAQMLENINQLLEQSLSPKSLGWRFDAWRTGRSYAEVVLSKTLEYQVEQVFLIHSETSLLIQHVVADMAITKDPDLVSSMLSAIQDYIHDSFAVDDSQTLNSMSLGDLTVLIEKGPNIILAAVVRGKIPQELSNVFKEALEEIHQRCGERLLAYSGDPDDFIELEPILKNCLLFRLQNKESEKKRKIPWLAIFFILSVAGIVSYFSYKNIQLESWRDMALSNLGNEPGIVVINASVNRDGELLITGLKDPLSADPAEVMQRGLPQQLDVSFAFQPYFSVETEIVETRARAVLQPPQEVSIHLENTRLIVSGNIDVAWAETLHSKWPSIHGIEELDLSDFTTYDPILIEIAALQDIIEGGAIYFDKSEIQAADLNLDEMANTILRLDSLAQLKGERIIVHLYGSTDETGNTVINSRIAQQRAQSIRAELLSLQIPEELIQIHGLQESLEIDTDPGERKVFFRVTGTP